MDVWVINLDRDHDRLAWMDSELERRGVAYRRMPAVYGKTATGRDAAFRDDPRRAHLGPGEIGCALSHIRLWERIVDAESDFALVLEDDVHFAPDFGAFFRALRLDPREICIHRFETFLARVTTARRPTYQVGSRAAYRLLTNHGGTAAYLVSKPTAARLLAIADEIVEAIDIALFDPARRVNRDVLIYQWAPAPCIQDMMLAGRGGRNFKSEIAGQRKDVREGVWRAETGAKHLVKEALRPVYTAAYALALAPTGRTRMLVDFA